MRAVTFTESMWQGLILAKPKTQRESLISLRRKTLIKLSAYKLLDFLALVFLDLSLWNKLSGSLNKKEAFKKLKLSMETLNNLIETLGINYTFFYHFLVATLLFFISKKRLWIPYIESMDKRNELTNGRLSNTKELDLKIQNQKDLYEKKAKKIHSDFQAVFNEIKTKALQDFSKKSLELETNYKASLTKKLNDLKLAVKNQEPALEQEISILSGLLTEKIKS